MYEIFYISTTSNTDANYLKIKSKYPRTTKLTSIDNFESIKKISFTKMFWVIWDDCILDESFDLDITIPEYDQQYIHVWKNGDYFDGIALFPNDRSISIKEFKSRFYLTDKKEIDAMASTPKPFDIIFISYNEPNANENYKILKERFPRATRIDGVKGIHQAHIEAAKTSTTYMFWVVDSDAEILSNFNFTMPQIPYYSVQERNDFNQTVHVWRSQNPINDLEYGYGGVKLLPKKLTLEMDLSKPDMTTSISNKFKIMPEVSNITKFNTDPFSTWRSAFRECAKLASKTIDRQDDYETNERLEIWTTKGSDRKFGEFALAGAKAGMEFGISNKDSIHLINDFNWLKEIYENQK